MLQHTHVGHTHTDTEGIALLDRVAIFSTSSWLSRVSQIYETTQFYQIYDHTSKETLGHLSNLNLVETASTLLNTPLLVSCDRRKMFSPKKKTARKTPASMSNSLHIMNNITLE